MTDWKASARSRHRPMIMGILNVTPDSFSDGGRYLDPMDAIAHALEMVDHGADILDIGGESTRPGSDRISADEELDRILPIISELSSITDIPISVDTMKAEVAEACIDAGATMINDVLGLRGDGMLDLAASSGVPVVIMYMHGNPRTLASDVFEGDIMSEVRGFIRSRIEASIDAGVRKENIIIDPGIGFGMTHEDSLELIRNCSSIVKGYPVLIGASRKRFLASAFPGIDRDDASIEAAKLAAASGADIIRVHDVASTLDALL